MTRTVQAAVLALLLAASPASAQAVPDLGEIRQKTGLSANDRSRIRAYVQQAVQAMLTSTDPDHQGIVAARQRLLEEVQNTENRSGAYRQAFAEEALPVLKTALEKAISQPARVNVVMTLAGLQTIEAVPLLESVLADDPYPASRYWAAKGLASLAPKIHERLVPRIEREIADTIGKVLQKPQPALVLMPLFDAVGTFDHERAHDVLADGLTRVTKDLDTSDPVVRRLVSEAIRSLERAYSREVRPDAKKALLLAYAALCAHIMPPVDASSSPAGYGRLMADLNASLEKITGDNVGFDSTDPLPLQQLSLLEWVERLARTKQIPRRPELPAAVEEAVEERQSGSGAAAREAVDATSSADKAVG